MPDTRTAEEIAAAVRAMLAARPPSTLTPEEQSALAIAIGKLRANAPLTERERELVERRGEELLALPEETPAPSDAGEELDEDEAEALLEAVVVSNDDLEHGRYITGAEMIEQLRAIR